MLSAPIFDSYFTRAIHTSYAAYGAAEAERAAMEGAFFAYDPARTGYVTRDEAQCALAALGLKARKENDRASGIDVRMSPHFPRHGAAMVRSMW